MNAKPVHKLLKSEMNRREFLGFVGVASLGIIGITGLMKGLNQAANRQTGQGYGTSPYGGGSER